MVTNIVLVASDTIIIEVLTNLSPALIFTTSFYKILFINEYLKFYEKLTKRVYPIILSIIIKYFYDIVGLIDNL